LPTVFEVLRAQSKAEKDAERIVLKKEETELLWIASDPKRLRNAVLALLGNRCVQCGFSNPKALQIDHVFSDGAYQRKAVGYTTKKFYIDILLGNVPRNSIQCLCANCNWMKRETHNELKRFK